MPDLKNKKVQQIIYILFITGAALLFIARLDFGTTKKQEPEPQQQEIAPDIEQRLQNTLSLVDGVGNVKVVIYYGSSMTKIIAKDKVEEVGDDTKRFQENVVLGSDNKPVVLRENTQEIKGVLIVAQGGGDPKIKSSLISATEALLGVEAHKIEVLKMK